jgi:hypothetical protein
MATDAWPNTEIVTSYSATRYMNTMAEKHGGKGFMLSKRINY